MNPIFQATSEYMKDWEAAARLTVEEGKFYFWNEIWVDAVGPYDTYAQAQQGLAAYCVQLNEPYTKG